MGTGRSRRQAASRQRGRRSAPSAAPKADLTPDELADRLEALRERLAPQLPDMDPGDLLLILQCVTTPWGRDRRIFLREVRPGVYVP
ncbi:MAG: hypothetical protein HY906_19495 [Deltaproteobacteria bacterium]|nr:hypothetical protein [Deltaproteobacteria bacterium]